ncbi:SDR family oxidoreductase [Curtobacterium pusillum]|uniref:SDR family NAD(P)-dependent oxidoreductase n=1 Tax=Curtobacterium pusillum TaxID=69373 RepID=A0ABX2MAC8_9MICO|nr:SDR family NAD(P)-dependent oxidoreductase [Curtobacterium pusillum]NUU13748.1 SDR family NAD(P)-dependent oxidoreductase [Curtobacterium pusillum]GLK30670.1 short-chain dehydrogenase [Curtobacterium pusillum]
MDIDGKVALVTGASSGIGESTARAAAAAGAKLVLAARRADRLEALAAELGVAVVVVTDMRDPEQIRNMIAVAVERHGGVDVLVNNAGQGLHVPVEQIQLDDLRAIVELNVYGPLLAMQLVAPLMRARGGGSIVNVSSGTTRLARTVGAGGYAASKAALNMLSRTARNELADDGISVSTVYPFVTETEFHDVLRAGGRPGARSGFAADPPERVAEAILELVRTGAEEALLVPEQLRDAVS